MARRVPYVPVDAKPLRFRMGLRPLDLEAWLDVDEKRADELAIKQRLLDSPTTRPVVLGGIPGHEAAARDVLELVVDNLATFHPGLVLPQGEGKLLETTTGTIVDPGVLSPLEAAARLVQEDLCLMVRSGPDWILGAAVVCFPSRWRLEDKIGATLRGIHSPVPDYEDALAGPAEAFFDRLAEDRPVWRLNWTLIGDPELHQPDAASRRADTRLDLVDPGRAVWFRVERQTLRRTPGAAIVFTIRTYVAALADVLASDPDFGPSLRVALSELDPDLEAYKGWSRIARSVLSWLSLQPSVG